MRLIEISGGYSCAVDDGAMDEAKTAHFSSGDLLTVVPGRFKWMALKVGAHKSPYAYNRIDRPGGRRFTVYLHRLLTQCPANMYVNHIDFDTLNCQMSNMEIVDAWQSSQWKRRRMDYLRSINATCAAVLSRTFIQDAERRVSSC